MALFTFSFEFLIKINKSYIFTIKRDFYINNIHFYLIYNIFYYT